MDQLTLIVALSSLAVCVALGVSQQRRHRRLRARLERVRVESVISHHLLSSAYERVVRLECGPTEPRIPIEFRSQHGEDMFILAMFPEIHHGFYIEAGAFDGYSYACSYPLEAIGWSGLLVEPLPHRAAECRNARPYSRVVQAALGAPGGARSVRLVAEQLDGHRHELSSHLEGCSIESDSVATTAGSFEVPLTTLDELLSEHDGPIHAVVLDLEGNELEGLRGFDLDRFKPILLIVEDHTTRDDSEIGRYLNQNGYEHMGWLSYNRIAVRRDHPEHLARAGLLLHQSDRGQDQPGSAPAHSPVHAASVEPKDSVTVRVRTASAPE